MIKKIISASTLLLLGLCGAHAEEQSDGVLKDSTVKIVEERRVVETRKVYEKENLHPRKTAIFVDNRAGSSLNDKVSYLEDQVTSRASGKNFSIISREEVFKAVKVYATEAGASPGIDQNQAANRNSLGTASDRMLSDNASALRTAQNLGADFLLFVNVGSFAKETKDFTDADIGVHTKNTVYNLRGTFKVVEGITGGALGGDAFRVSKTIRQTPNLKTETDDIVNELLDSAAEKIADGLAAKAAQFVPPSQPGKVEISVACAAKDLQGNEISLPDLRLTEDGKVVDAGKTLPVQVSATVEIDGFASGTTPAKIKVAPGAHKLRLTRPGFETIDLTINAAEGLALNPTMQMSEDGFRRWKEIRNFLNGLDTSRKLTDAAVEEIRGRAQMLRQSGFLVDYRVNTTGATPLVSYKSIY